MLINGAQASLAEQSDGQTKFTGYARVDSGTRWIDIAVYGGGAPLLERYPVQAERPVRGIGVATASFAKRRARGKRWAVVIGVSKYRDAGVRPLRYADADAKAFHELLLSDRAGLGGFKPEETVLLLNEQATFQAIRQALRSFLRKATEDDIVVLYFAGHGGPDPERIEDQYLYAYDTQASDIATTGVPMNDVAEATRRVSARDMVVIVDACHSAGVAGQVARRGDGNNRINDAFLQRLESSSGGLVMFTASAASQESQEGPQWGGGHGVFTHYMLEALRGRADEDKDQIVTLGEMMEWVRDKVRRETNNAQIPSISQTAYDYAWPMAVVPEAASTWTLGPLPMPSVAPLPAPTQTFAYAAGTRAYQLKLFTEATLTGQADTTFLSSVSTAYKLITSIRFAPGRGSMMDFAFKVDTVKGLASFYTTSPGDSSARREPDHALIGIQLFGLGPDSLNAAALSLGGLLDDSAQVAKRRATADPEILKSLTTASRMVVVARGGVGVRGIMSARGQIVAARSAGPVDSLRNPPVAEAAQLYRHVIIKLPTTPLARGVTWIDTVSSRVISRGFDSRSTTIIASEVMGDTIVGGKKAWMVARTGVGTLRGVAAATARGTDVLTASAQFEGMVYLSESGAFLAAVYTGLGADMTLTPSRGPTKRYELLMSSEATIIER